MHWPVRGHLWTGPENLFLMNSKVDRISMHAPYEFKSWESIRYTTNNNHLINPAFGKRDQLVCSLMFIIIQISFLFICTVLHLLHAVLFLYMIASLFVGALVLVCYFFLEKIKTQNCWHSTHLGLVYFRRAPSTTALFLACMVDAFFLLF